MKITTERLSDGSVNVYEDGKLRANYPPAWSEKDAAYDYGLDRMYEKKYA